MGAAHFKTHPSVTGRAGRTGRSGEGGRGWARVGGREHKIMASLHTLPQVCSSARRKERANMERAEMGKEGISSEGKRMSWGIGDNPASGLMESQRSREPLERGPKQHQ